ncbi:MAG: endolytic transglycosylase MltG [Spirochaetia bacterium]|nr:endolytic transglycosylase MltG [Spirochaetia bacterium]
MRNVKILVTVLIILFVVFPLSCLTGFWLLGKPVAPGTVTEHIFQVERGDGFNAVAVRLKKDGLIRSSLYMRVLDKLDKSGDTLKAGQYSLNPAMSAREIRDMLLSGAGILYKVTVPEGATLKKIASIMELNGLASSDDFILAASSPDILSRYDIPGDTAEGFLFPDSYFFQKGLDVQVIVTTMIDNFFARLSGSLSDYKKLAADELYDKVIMASIIEREYRVAEEAPVIASVFYNRLENRIPLASCATVEYVLTEIMGHTHPGYLTYDDIAVDSPYNTYIHRGLPPGPVSNPGLVSLNAAFSPAETDYLFFLLKDSSTGEHYFSREFSEHKHARQIYLKH